jgi:hypothetical protein
MAVRLSRGRRRGAGLAQELSAVAHFRSLIPASGAAGVFRKTLRFRRFRAIQNGTTPMSLPTPAQMQELSALIVEHGKLTKGKWYTYKGMQQALERNKGAIASLAVSSGASTGVVIASGTGTALASATGVAVLGPLSLTLIPFGAVLAPWIAAADIARVAGDIFELHDLKDDAGKGVASKRYKCVCGKCAENIKYVVDKKERNVGRVAIGVGTLGVSTLFTRAHSIVKSFQSGRPKEMVSRGLVASARGGCTVASAAIFLMCGNWAFMRGGNAAIMRRAIAVITSEDGWEVLKREW